MAIPFALIFSSLLVLLNISQQIHGTTAPLAGSNILPCTESNGYVSTPLAPQFWTLNSSYFEVSLGIMSPYFIYLFVVTSIEIELGDGSDGINISQYLITYTRDNVYSAPLSELSTNMSRTSKSAKVTINPIFINKMSISRFIDSNDNFLVRYIIKGFTTPRVEVLSYLIAQPNLNRNGVIISDNSYTGMCNGEVCYGGRGQLMDGVIGMESDNSASGLKIGWRCTAGNIICSFPLRILLTGQVIVSHLILYGTTTDMEVISPNVTLIQPKIATNSTLNTTTNPYTLTIPINLLTDTIFLNMEIPGGRVIVLSEVEVFSNGVNIALFNVEYRESIEPVSATTQTPVSCVPSPTPAMTSPTIPIPSPTPAMTSPTIPIPSPNINKTSILNTPCPCGPPNTVVSTSNTNLPSTSTNEPNTTEALTTTNQVDSIPFIIFPLIIAALLLMLLIAMACCIFLYFKYKNVRHQLDLVKSPTLELLDTLNQDPSQPQRSRYSDRANTLYATIGPDPSTDLKHKPDRISEYNKNTSDNYVSNTDLLENPLYGGDKKVTPDTETLNTISELQSPLNIPIGHLNKNFQMEDSNIAQSNEKGLEDEEKLIAQNDRKNYELNENPLYKDLQVMPHGYEQIVLNEGDQTQTKVEDFSSYDSLKH